MRRLLALIFTSALVVFLSTVPVLAGETKLDSVTTQGTSDDTYNFRGNNSSGTRVFSVDKSGNTYIAGTLSNARVREFTLPLMGFVLSTGEVVTSSTAPGLEVDDSIPGIVWADGETTPVMATFRVPTDYSSGGAFRLLATESDSTTPNRVDFDVYVNRDGLIADSSATNQTPVALAGTTSTGSVVTLTPATDFASLAAGDWVTLRFWRDNVAAGTGDLEVKGVSFFYTATQ